MFQLRFADGGELVLTEAGKKKRAGVWIVTPGAAGRGSLAPRPGRARDRRADARARSWSASAASSIRSSATSARSRASGGPTRTRSSGRRDSRRSGSRPISATRRSRPRRRRSARTSSRALELPDRRQRRRRRLPRSRPLRRAVPPVRRDIAPGGLRGAHDHVLPGRADGRADPQGPPPVAPAALTSRERCSRQRVAACNCAHGCRPRSPDIQASAPPVGLALSRAGVTGVHKAIRIRRGAQEILMSAEIDCTVDLSPRPEGRSHVAVPGAVRRGDRRGRARRGAARRGARRPDRVADRANASGRCGQRCASRRAGRYAARPRSRGSRPRRSCR